MKKILLMLVVFMFVIGCGQQAVENVGEDGVVSDQTGSTESVSGEEQETEVVEEPQKEMSQDVMDILAKKEKVKSYSYMEWSGTKNTYHIDLANDKIKIELFERVGKAGEIYDTVVLDGNTKDAYGYCLSVTSCEVDEREFYREVDYDDFYPAKTPLDWLNDITYAELTDRTKTLANTKVLLLNFDTETTENGEMWVHNFYALPYEITVGDATVEFQDISVPARDSSMDIPSDLVIIPTGMAVVDI